MTKQQQHTLEHLRGRGYDCYVCREDADHTVRIVANRKLRDGFLRLVIHPMGTYKMAGRACRFEDIMIGE